MEINKKYLRKYLHDIAIEQISEEYAHKGYTISKEEKLGKYRADIIARKDNEQIVIEVKSGTLTPQKKEQIAGLADYIRSLGGYKFLVVIATPPKEKKLEISNIEDLLYSYLLEESPDDLLELSTHALIEEVVDIDIDEIKIDGKYIHVKGDGVVNMELQFGSDGDQNRDDGFKTTDNFPFDFNITLEYDTNFELIIADVHNLKIDTKSYYS